MTSPTYLITGANRGIGLEYCKQILAGDPHAQIIASVRHLAGAEGTTNELAKLEHKYDGRIERLQMDIGDLQSVARAAEACKELSFAKGGIDVLLCNAGVLAGGFGGPLEPPPLPTLAENLRINVLGNAAVIDAFLPFLRAGAQKRIWIVGTRAAAFSGNWSEADTAATYTASKAALHLYGLKLARALMPEGFTVIVFSPGWVQTEMGGEKAQISVEESVEKGLQMLLARTPEDGAKFWNYSGEEIGW